jgi:serine/threonine protein kinase/Flp pilus assembly protein TadD
MNLTAGTQLGRYKILSLIGKGGMGEVYLANDTELDRTVAVKILPPAVASDQQRLQRFVQEAKSASALNHPHIITIYEIGSTGDSKFIATEFIDGETLRERMNHGLRLLDVLEFSSQIASALVAAHTAGIVHRDIKPENVMVRKDGYVKVLDFGLAKLTEAKDSTTDTEAPTRAMVNTGAGTVMGTATYMSPEQAKGVRIDERTDIWSLGALLYEMITGHVPFKGETPTETISLILLKEPPSMARYADDIPDELDRIVTKALTKDLDERYQTAKDLLIDLKHLKRKIEVDAEIDRTVPPEIRAAASTHSQPGASTVSGSNSTQSFTAERRASSAEYIVSEIKRHRTGAYVAAGVAILAIAGLAFFYLPLRTPALTEKDTVLLADFVNTTGEPVFDGTLNQALSVQLGQSPYLNIFPDDRVREALRFMGKQANERVTRDVAKEICQRNGIKAMILSSIAGLGSHYVLTIEAVNAVDGSSIAKEQIESDSKEHVLTSLGKAAASLREKLGESLTTLKKYDAQIEQATTSSLDALKAYTQGNEKRVAGHEPESIQFYKKAIETDPNFAMAYARLAVVLNNGGETQLSKQYSQKAYELRDRVSERERFYIEEKYTSYVSNDRDDAVQILKSWTESYPNDYIPRNNLAVNYLIMGRFEEAQSEAREAIRLSPNNSTPQGNYVESFIRLGRFDEARQVLEQTLGQDRDRAVYRNYSLRLAFIQGDQDIINRDLEWLSKDTTMPDYTEFQTDYSGFHGQWRKALEFSHRSMDLYLREDRKESAADVESVNAVYESQFGDCQKAKESVARGVAMYRTKTVTAPAAVALATCSDPRAQSMLDELQKESPKDTGLNFFFAPLIHAILESNRGNADQAIQALQPAMRFAFGIRAIGARLPRWLRARLARRDLPVAEVELPCPLTALN